jgi:hypothetical protein
VKERGKPAGDLERRIEDAFTRMADLDKRSIWVTMSDATSACTAPPTHSLSAALPSAPPVGAWRDERRERPVMTL